MDLAFRPGLTVASHSYFPYSQTVPGPGPVPLDIILMLWDLGAVDDVHRYMIRRRARFQVTLRTSTRNNSQKRSRKQKLLPLPAHVTLP
jgi:hypothetical protein